MQQRAALIVAAAVLVAFTLLAFGNLRTTSPTSDETVHLVAGYSYLVTHDYRVNPEHPPLAKMLAALPLLTMQIWPAHFGEAADGTRAFAFFREAWAMCVANPAFSEWRVAQLLLYGVRDSTLLRVGGDALDPPTTASYARADFLNDAETMFFRARLVMLFLGIALGIVLWCWSHELWGAAGAAFAVMLFCFDPNFIAHSTLVTTDVPLALAYLVTLYCFWRFAQRPSVLRGILFALAFALAQTVKFSAVLLAPGVVFIAVWEIVRDRQRLRPMVAAVAGSAVCSLIVIWAVYGFRYSSVPDPEKARLEEVDARATLRQQVLNAPDVWPTGHLDVQRAVARWSGMEVLSKISPEAATDIELRRVMRSSRPGITARFLLFAAEHHLLPEAYLYGFAAAMSGSLLRSSYLDGRYSTTGFSSYFLWTTVWKTPIPVLFGSLIGVLMAFRFRRRASHLVFLIVPSLIYAWAAATAQIHIGHRHLLPLLPLVYTLAGAAGAWWNELVRRAWTAVLVVAWLAASALVVFFPRPISVINQHLAYINEFGGGPKAGALKLSDSNFDWGQDLKRLGQWYASSGISDPIDLVYFGNADPRSYGIRYRNLRRPDFPEAHGPGIFAISQSDYLGLQFDAQHRRPYWDELLARHGAQRIDAPTRSIFVWRLTR